MNQHNKKAPNLPVRGLIIPLSNGTAQYYSIGMETPGAIIPFGSTVFLSIFAMAK